tara:strand:- start:1325 stop:1723 length:399 start_codon:yes stop_codon:yes gene_type:complete
MTHLAVVKVNAQGRIEKFQEYDSQAEANAHVTRVLETFPLAYAVARPAGGPSAWLCDTAAKTAIYDPLPPSPPTQDEIDSAAAKAYAKLTALRGMTPAQVGSWVDANVTNLAQAQDAIKTLAIAVSILARRL